MVQEACVDIELEWKLLFWMPVAGKILKNSVQSGECNVQQYEWLGQESINGWLQWNMLEWLNQRRKTSSFVDLGVDGRIVKWIVKK